MRTTHKRQNWILPAIVGAVMIPGSAMTAQAAEEEHGTSSPLPIAGIESVLEECYEVNVKENIDLYLVPTEQGEYVNRAFSNTSDFTYIEVPRMKQVTGPENFTVIRRQRCWSTATAG